MAAEDFGRTYEGNDEKSDYPTGCFVYGSSRGVYFNKHESGTRNTNAKSICKKGTFNHSSRIMNTGKKF